MEQAMISKPGDGDASPEYWEDYSNHQHVKHALVREYLNGWLPKLGTWAGRILYVDTHAGKGRHKTGHLGSPLVALKTLLDHKYHESHFSRCEIKFFFIERHHENFEFLNKEVAAIGQLPSNVKVRIIQGNCLCMVAIQQLYITIALCCCCCILYL